MGTWRGFILLMTFVAIPSLPAFGQVASSGAPKIATPIPDFSGLWAHPYIPGFEPPLSGPGPVVNKARRRQIFDSDGRPIGTANAPLVSDVTRMVGDYTNPILKPQAAEAVKRHGELESNGIGAPTPSNQCWPEQVPYVFWNFGMEMIQQPNAITILYAWNHEVRHVRINQPHPAHVLPSAYGDSVGHYEDDTLVIDTVGIKVLPFSIVDRFGTPHSEALHVIERYRLLDYDAAKDAQERGGKENFRIPTDPAEGWVPDPKYKGPGLQLQFTVEDNGAFTTPWSAMITYRRPLRTDWTEIVCAENLVIFGKETPVPRANKSDF